MNIRFTIAVATYNSEHVIKELLDSIYNQTYQNFEFICIDGYSSDKTLSIVNKYTQKTDKVISEPDLGVYDAMNKALRIATGDYLIFMGSDDHFISYNVLHNVAIAIKESKCDNNTLFYGGCYMEKYHQVINKEQKNWSWIRGTMCHQCIFYPKSIYKKYQYDLRYKINADYAYNLNLWRIVNFKHIDVIVSYFSDGGISGSDHYDIQFRKDLPYILKKKCGIFPYLFKKIRLFMGRVFKGRPQ